MKDLGYTVDRLQKARDAVRYALESAREQNAAPIVINQLDRMIWSLEGMQRRLDAAQRKADEKVNKAQQ